VHDLQVPHQHARSDVHVTGSELNFYLGGSDFHIWTRAILPLVEIASIFGVKIQQKAVAMLPSRDRRGLCQYSRRKLGTEQLTGVYLCTCNQVMSVLGARGIPVHAIRL
jgi:hypothetical protein